jgi:drug/metabolite transporter (DMT)-like permease
VFGTIASGVLQPWIWRMPAADVWLMPLAAGLLGALAQLLIAHALRVGPSSVISPFNYMAIVWGIIIDLLIWSVYPSVWTLAGAAVITLAGVYISCREGRPTKDTP